MKNLSNWGFKIEDRNKDSVTYRGKANGSQNFMYLYKILDGIYIYDIHFNESYSIKDTDTIHKSGYRVAYCKEGTYTSIINESRIFISTGEVFIGKSIPNSSESKTLTGKNRAFNILISPHEINYDEYENNFFNIKEIIKAFLINLSKLKQLGFSVDNPIMVNCAEEIISALNSKDLDYIKLKVIEMLYLTSKINLKKQQKKYMKYEDKLIQKAKDAERYIQKNYEKKITLDELCTEFKISRNSLNNCFKNIFQYSPHEYLIKVRVLKAQELLINTNSNITDIALQVGFDNSSNFTRVFKKFCMLPPTIYREQNNK